MAFTVVSKPSGFQPVGAGELLYVFTVGSLPGDNYRVEIEFDGLDLPVVPFYPDPDLTITCNIANILRLALAMSADPLERLKKTYVKYQEVWDGGSNAQVDLSSDIIYAYVGTNNYFNNRTQFEILTTGGDFLLPEKKLRTWPGRTTYAEFLNGLDTGWVFSLNDQIYFGSGAKELASVPLTGDEGDAALQQLGWTSGSSASDSTWEAIAFGNGTFVAVGNSVCMTSTDGGVTWTSQTIPAELWLGICYASSQFVAVGINVVATSPDGITWTSQTPANTFNWRGVCYGAGAGLYVAVAYSGASNRVMTSPDGVTWTARASAANNQWMSVVWTGTLFVAVAINGHPTQVMTSPDGITWTLRTTPSAMQMYNVAYGAGKVVALDSLTTGYGMYSEDDGITWTLLTNALNGIDASGWRCLTYGAGAFVALCANTYTKVLMSNNGINWYASVNGYAARIYYGVVYGDGQFVGVTQTGTGDRVARSTLGATIEILEVELGEECDNPIYVEWINDYGGLFCWLFDVNQVLNLFPEDDGRFREYEVAAYGLTETQWEQLQELNRIGAEYGDNQKLGAYVVDATDEDNLINLFPIPQQLTTETKLPQHTFGIALRYPKIYNVDI